MYKDNENSGKEETIKGDITMKVNIKSGMYGASGLKVGNPHVESWTVQNEHGQGLVVNIVPKLSGKEKPGQFLEVHIPLKELKKVVKEHEKSGY